MSTESLNQMIGLRAYEIYQRRERDGRPGNSEQDWHEAVQEVMAELKKKEKAAKVAVDKKPAPKVEPKAEVKKAAPVAAKPVAAVAKPVVAAKPVAVAKPVAAPAKKKAAKKK